MTLRDLSRIMKINDILFELENGPGYSLQMKINEEEYQFLKSTIENDFSKIIEKYVAKNILREKNISLKNYESLSKLISHERIWTKVNRMLDKKTSEIFIKSEYYESLKRQLNVIEISDEENLGYPNLYWRIVRTKKNEDIGPLHRDEWFWLINPSSIKQFDHKRIKVWIPIIIEPNLNGLIVVPYSQKDNEIKWETFQRGMAYKPRLINQINDEDKKLLPTKEKDTVIFHDKLIHGGAKNNGSFPRVSLEFTLLCEQDSNSNDL